MNPILIAAADTDLSALEIISKTFHLKWPYFIAQVVNFFLVIFVLKKFAFGPIQQILEERKERIAAGEANLEKIEKQLADSEKRTAEAIEKANSEAARLIEEAKSSAASLTEAEAKKATASAQSIISKAHDAAEAEREMMKTQLKAEFGKLVASATGQVTGKVLNDDDQRRINDEALNTLPN